MDEGWWMRDGGRGMVDERMMGGGWLVRGEGWWMRDGW